MTTTETPPKPKLIHIAKIYQDGFWKLLFLRHMTPHHFEWFMASNTFEETPTAVFADSIQEAIRLAIRTWKIDYFKSLNCGFRYNLPERDEHGINALFHQMAASQTSFGGIYFDEELGHNCFVQNASMEAKDLLQRLRDAGKL